MSFSVSQSWAGRAGSRGEARTLGREEGGRGSRQEGGRDRKKGGGRSRKEGWMRDEQERWMREEQEGGSDEELVGEEPAAAGSGSGKKLTKRQRLAAEREEISFYIQSCNSWKICLQEW